ncbi:MAG: IS3 family transposase [Gemmataceae bacterium]
MRYRCLRPGDAAERAAMKAVADERRRFDYRRIHIMLERLGTVMNLKKLLRLYREKRLQMRNRGGRKWALGTRRPMVLPQAANERWSIYFISDAFGKPEHLASVGFIWIDIFRVECPFRVADPLSGYT